MSNFISIDNIQERDTELYKKVIDKGIELTKEDDEIKDLYKEIEDHVKKIESLSSEVDSFEDYRLLSDAAIKWYSVFSTNFGKPKDVNLSEPKQKWLPPMPSDPSRLDDIELDNWLIKCSKFIEYAQRLEHAFSGREIFDSNHIAEIFLASEILDGKINFPKRISPRSYPRLENIWLKDVKCLMAYFEWDKCRRFFFCHDLNFFNASNHIRNMLVEEGIKALSSEFEDPKKYICNNYLEDNYKLRSVKQCPKLYDLIQKKAYRINETTGSTDNYKNWIQAETYIGMFYENIIPAVEKNDKERVLRVIKSFQYSKMNRFLIINCFEAILAIYFLNEDIIKDLWEEARGKPYPFSTVEYTKTVDSWPEDFETDNSRFWIRGNQIGFKGVMSIEERDSLKSALKLAKGKVSKEHEEAIEDIYNQSRLIHQETTL